MDRRKIILEELQSVSPTVAGIDPVNPYQVPQGYFETFPLNMLGLVKDEQPSLLLINAKLNPYSVPVNYFQDLPQQILSLALNNGSDPLLAKSTTNPYEVPTGFFDGFAERMLHLAKAQDFASPNEELESLSPLLNNLEKKTPFTVPEGYFEDLTSNTVAGIKAIDFVNENIENLSPLMQELRNLNPYPVPTGYFENLPETMLEKVLVKQPARSVSMDFRKKVIRFAAAAVVVGILFIAGFLYLNREGASIPELAQTEENIPQDTISGLQGLSDDELSNYIENQTVALPDYLNITGIAEIDGEDIKLMLADIPDSELKQYIDEFSGENQVMTN